MAESRTTKDLVPHRTTQSIMVSTEHDPEIRDYLTALRDDPAFDHTRRQVIQRLERAGYKIESK